MPVEERRKLRQYPDPQVLGQRARGTSRFASNLIGDSQVLRAKHSCRSSRGRAFSRSGHDSTSEGVSYRHVAESAVMASEIEQLADLQGLGGRGEERLDPSGLAPPAGVEVDF